MAKATGKRVNNWTQLESTKEFLTTLESITGIPVIDSKVGGVGIPENERGTWAIEEVAIDFAQWCSVEFRIWVNRQIKTLMTTGKVELSHQQQPTQDIDVNELSILRLGLTSVNPALVDGFILNEVGKVKPHLLPQINEAHKLLASTTDIPEVLMTPTLIGKELNITAIKVNKLLTAAGYQIKNVNKSKGSPDYIATEKGKPYSELTMATGRNGDNTTYQHLKWNRSIIDILGELV